MIVLALFTVTFSLTAADPTDQTQIENYSERSNAKYKKYHIDVPGKEPITILETNPGDEPRNEWVDISLNLGKGRDDIEIKNLMTDVIHDHSLDNERPRCYGPSCQEGFNENEGPQGEMDDISENIPEKLKDYRDYSSDRLQAINALAAKLKYEKFKADRYNEQNSNNDDNQESDGNGKVYTAWNRLKVKQHKHPFDDKDGWITLEPIAWSTSKISKWKPNVKKQKPTWTSNDDRFQNEDKYSVYQGIEMAQNYPTKRPTMIRPTFINNKLHISTPSTLDWESEIPSKPSWNKPSTNYYSYPSAWNPDEGRRPHKPNCDSEENHSSDEAVLFGMSDSVATDNRPSYFPYEYEALKRPVRRPTQVVYAGSPDIDSERASRPPHGDGQWVLLSTTKGYRNKKRQRSLSTNVDNVDPSPITSHQAVALTVLPVDDVHKNMTTSHGGLLEVERSFQTVEEAKRDMDRKQYSRPDEYVTPDIRPGGNRVIRRKIISNVSPDSATVLAAVGAGMVPATMAMVVPMMLGKRRRRDLRRLSEDFPEQMLFKYQ